MGNGLCVKRDDRVRPEREEVRDSTMPFWKKDKNKNLTRQESGDSNGETNGARQKVDYKAKLQKKQYLAQESPEPVYDLIDCGLKNVPAGVYSMCKVQRKEALLLHENELTSLSGGGSLTDLSSCLQVLDLHYNNLEKLPDEIGMLKELKVLYVHHNKLKRLPETLGQLRKLQSLNVSHNLLKELPESLSKLPRLKSFDVANNPKLKKLPASLAKIRSVETLVVDLEHITFPSSEVCSQGTEAIMKFLCTACDIDYISPSEYRPPDDGIKDKQNGVLDPYEQIVRGSLMKLEQQKEDKRKNMLALEKDLAEQQAKEAALAVKKTEHNKKLLNDLIEEEKKITKAVKNLQELKDKEREALNSKLYEAETLTDSLITELVAKNNSRSDPKKVLEDLERERKEMEDMFTIKAGEAEKLAEKDVLSAMQNLMQEELRREQARREYEQGRKDVISSALNKDLENDKAVEHVLNAKGKQQQQLITSLLEDEKYQREAFSALLTKQDAMTREMSMQMEQIQNELASLSMIEMTKRDMKVEFEKEIMGEKRETLTKLLMNLMHQKEERAKELDKRLRELEDRRSEEQDNYWLIQYQKLLDSKPKSLVSAEKNLESGLKELLVNAAAEEFMPVFAKRNLTLKQVSYMTDKELLELGVHSQYMRQRILLSIEEYKAMQDRLANKLSGLAENGEAQPSAPPEEADPNAPSAPSAPPAPVETFQSTECVVCLEAKCDIIFLPCGHVCSCFKCEVGLNQCPLCRVDIIQKVRLR